MARTNRIVEAMKEDAHLLGVGALFAAAAATLSPLPILVGIVLEAAYLLFVPDSGWYQSRLARRFDAEVEARRARLKTETFAVIRTAMQERFSHLEEMRSQIDQQSSDDKEWFREVVRKLDYLLEKFLLFAAREAQFRSYLDSLRAEVRGVAPEPAPRRPQFRVQDRRTIRSGPQLRIDQVEPVRAGPEGVDDRWVREAVAEVQGHYDQQRQIVEADLNASPDDDTKAVLQKRLDVLQRRNEFAGKIGKILTNINHQLQLVEDTFGLINDEIRARTPEQILADIDEVVVATDSMSESLAELAPYEQLAARLTG